MKRKHGVLIILIIILIGVGVYLGFRYVSDIRLNKTLKVVNENIQRAHIGGGFMTVGEKEFFRGQVIEKGNDYLMLSDGQRAVKVICEKECMMVEQPMYILKDMKVENHFGKYNIDAIQVNDVVSVDGEIDKQHNLIKLRSLTLYKNNQ